MVEHVRPARTGDVPEVQRLISDALRSVGAQEPPGGSIRLTPEEPPGAEVVLVGELDGVVVGVLCLRVEHQPPGSTTATPPQGPVGLVELVHVEPGARELGIGALLVSGAVQWCTAHGIATIDAQALPGDRTTKRLLEASGFRTQMLRMRLRSSTASAR